MMKTPKQVLRIVGAVFLLCCLIVTQASALEVPVSQSEHMIDGKQTLTKVFEVGPDFDPEQLIEPDFEQNGFIYHMTSITKDVGMVVDKITVTQEHEIVIDKADEDEARLDALMSMPAYIEYDQEGYTGRLYPVINTIKNRETGRTNHAGRKSITQQYTFDYNDDSLVPTSANGMALSDIKWSEGAYLPDTAIPENYVATATYTKGYSYSTVDGWTFSMEYTGDVQYESETDITYTITYTGSIPEPDVTYYCGIEEHFHTADCFNDDGVAVCGFAEHKHGSKCLIEPELSAQPEPGFFEKLFGGGSSDTEQGGGSGVPKDPGSSAEASSDSSGKLPVWKVLLGILCLLMAVMAGAFAVLNLIRYVKYSRVQITACNESTGEVVPLKPIWFDRKTASITIDTLKVPSANHYTVSLKSQLAEQMKGKVITIKADQKIIKHTIGAALGPDYNIEVSLD